MNRKFIANLLKSAGKALITKSLKKFRLLHKKRSRDHSSTPFTRKRQPPTRGTNKKGKLSSTATCKHAKEQGYVDLNISFLVSLVPFDQRKKLILLLLHACVLFSLLHHSLLFVVGS